MRTIEEQMAEIRRRSDRLSERRRKRWIAAAEAAAFCAAFALIAVAGVMLARLPARGAEMTKTALGSILSAGVVGGYVVIGFFSFLLGCSVTMLCLLLRRRSRGKRRKP